MSSNPEQKKIVYVVVKTSVHYGCGKTRCMEECVAGIHVFENPQDAIACLRRIQSRSTDSRAEGIKIEGCEIKTSFEVSQFPIIESSSDEDDDEDVVEVPWETTRTLPWYQSDQLAQEADVPDVDEEDD